jgi:hypothetical protein
VGGASSSTIVYTCDLIVPRIAFLGLLRTRTTVSGSSSSRSWRMTRGNFALRAPVGMVRTPTGAVKSAPPVAVDPVPSP